MGRQSSPDPESVPAPAPENSSPQSSAAFDAKAQAWDAYTDTPLGQLRQELILHHLVQHIGPPDHHSTILDAGGGTGNYAFPLAQRGYQVCLLDFSAPMLGIARRIAEQHGPELAGRIEFRCATVQAVPNLFSGGQFDIILCHTLLEYVSDPWQVLHGLVTVLRPGGLISLVGVNRYADPLRLAIAKGDLEKAIAALSKQSSSADLFGMPRRTFSIEELREAAGHEGLHTVATYGIRIFADYLPGDRLVDPVFRERLLALETAASALEPYRSIARYIHLLGRSPSAGE